MANKNIDREDIVGKRFGKLEVLRYAGLEFVGNQQRRRSFYICRCDCGNIVKVPRDKLTTGHKISCGKCFRIVREAGHCRYYDSKGKSFIFDEADIDIVRQYRWTVGDTGYPSTTVGRSLVLLSRMLMGGQPGQYIDHINGDPGDNRRSNLRFASPSENQRNRSIPAHNTTGYKGVYRRKDRKKLYASIQVRGKKIPLGTYNSAIEAAGAYDRAARYYFGEFACVNFPEKGEQCCFRNEVPSDSRMAV